MIKQILRSQLVQIFLVFFFTSLVMSLTTEVNDSYGIIEGGKGLVLFCIFFSSGIYATIMGKSDAHIIIENHNSRFIFRGLLLSFQPGILYIQQGEIGYIYVAFFAYSVFFFTFNTVYNEERGLNKFYIGSTSNIDKVIKWLDTKTFLKNYDPWLYWVYVILIVTTLYLAISRYLLK